jgi:hypothetical protein
MKAPPLSVTAVCSPWSDWERGDDEGALDGLACGGVVHHADDLCRYRGLSGGHADAEKHRDGCHAQEAQQLLPHDFLPRRDATKLKPDGRS